MTGSLSGSGGDERTTWALWLLLDPTGDLARLVALARSVVARSGAVEPWRLRLSPVAGSFAVHVTAVAPGPGAGRAGERDDRHELDLGSLHEELARETSRALDAVVLLVETEEGDAATVRWFDRGELLREVGRPEWVEDGAPIPLEDHPLQDAARALGVPFERLRPADPVEVGVGGDDPGLAARIAARRGEARPPSPGPRAFLAELSARERREAEDVRRRAARAERRSVVAGDLAVAGCLAPFPAGVLGILLAEGLFRGDHLGPLAALLVPFTGLAIVLGLRWNRSRARR